MGKEGAFLHANQGLNLALSSIIIAFFVKKKYREMTQNKRHRTQAQGTQLWPHDFTLELI